MPVFHLTTPATRLVEFAHQACASSLCLAEAPPSSLSGPPQSTLLYYRVSYSVFYFPREVTPLSLTQTP